MPINKETGVFEELPAIPLACFFRRDTSKITSEIYWLEGRLWKTVGAYKADVCISEISAENAIDEIWRLYGEGVVFYPEYEHEAYAAKLTQRMVVSINIHPSFGVSCFPKKN